MNSPLRRRKLKRHANNLLGQVASARSAEKKNREEVWVPTFAGTNGERSPERDGVTGNRCSSHLRSPPRKRGSRAVREGAEDGNLDARLRGHERITATAFLSAHPRASGGPERCVRARRCGLWMPACAGMSGSQRLRSSPLTPAQAGGPERRMMARRMATLDARLRA